MGQLAFEHQVRDRLQGLNHLQPLFFSTYDIPRRLREYDPALFVVFNANRQQYEVHSLNHVGHTYAADVPGNVLDARVETVIRQGDLRVHGKRVFAEIDAHNASVRARKKRDQKNFNEAAARELHSVFRPLGWEGI